MHASSLILRKGTFRFGPVSLDFRRGEIISIMGRIGSGKTTLLELLSNITEPDGGTVSADGRVAVVFQNPEDALFAATVFDDVSYVVKKEYDRKTLEEKVKGALSVAGLGEDLLWRSPFELSGGEKRKCAIASALMGEPDWLLLDEPLSGMSGRARTSFMETLGRLKEKGIGIIMVTHDSEAAALTDRLIIMEEGKVSFDGMPRKVLADAAKAGKHGLEGTFASRVAALIPEIGSALTLDEIAGRCL